MAAPGGHGRHGPREPSSAACGDTLSVRCGPTLPAMILSASRRTDVPALYAEWFARRLAEGWCEVPNPRNARQVARISLAAEDVEAFVFWTRHARPFLPVVETLLARGTPFYFQYTLTGYGPPLERRSPPVEVATRTFRELTARLPAGAVVWRYDPIVLGEAFPPEAHLARFERLAGALEGAARRVVVSLLDPYAKTRRRLAALGLAPPRALPDSEMHPGAQELLGRLAAIARDHGLVPETCAEPRDWSAFGLAPGRCVDDRLLAELTGRDFARRKDPGQREHCRCVESRDLGTPDSCTLGCAYCYAVRSDALARARRRAHEPAAPRIVTAQEALPGAGASGSRRSRE